MHLSNTFRILAIQLRFRSHRHTIDVLTQVKTLRMDYNSSFLNSSLSSDCLQLPLCIVV